MRVATWNVNGLRARLDFVLHWLRARKPDIVGLQELSKHSANLILFYEKYGFSARAAYNWRDDYFTGLTQANAAEFSEPYGQLDIGLSYRISNNFTVTLDALNLINEPEESYQEISERWLAYRLNDTRYQNGVRVRF